MFTYAICRSPGQNFAKGLTTTTFSKPDFRVALSQHTAYCDALRKAGIKIILLEADENHPDGCFVEDTAIVTEAMAVITQPGDPTRMGEQDSIAKILSEHKKLEFINGSGHVDGGDILRVQSHFYIGRSQRTNQEGANQLADILGAYGFSSSEIPVSHVLHLKSAVSHIEKDTIIGMKEYMHHFPNCDMIEIDSDESYAANCLMVNGHLLLSAGHPKTKTQLAKLNDNIIELNMSEFRKMDGSLTCLSLLF